MFTDVDSEGPDRGTPAGNRRPARGLMGANAVAGLDPAIDENSTVIPTLARLNLCGARVLNTGTDERHLARPKASSHRKTQKTHQQATYHSGSSRWLDQRSLFLLISYAIFLA
ncbi:hypothetical protein PoB_004405000 [Plakobranchus ocellatus]|uniref:Uncharacterized protein n=1 Tax=Plakobranchus ocellatus TaxID=259542 RepID=A0AAV4BAB6_9GAST|nr:hypothetical protein PoB_004405000 [Plakobranchus ocellatus]